MPVKVKETVHQTYVTTLKNAPAGVLLKVVHASKWPTFLEKNLVGSLIAICKHDEKQVFFFKEMTCIPIDAIDADVSVAHGAAVLVEQVREEMP